MVINADDPIDLTGLNKRDLRDIDRSLKIECKRFENEDFDDYTKECLKASMYRALIVCKKLNKEKYTPKKYRKQQQE